MDKVQKIREEVARMHDLLPVMDGDNIYLNYADRICTTLEMYIDSLQEEPKFKVGQYLKQGDTIVKILEVSDDGYHCDNAFVPFTAQDSWKLVEEPASEELGEAADNALSNVLNTHKIVNVRSCLEMFRLGAKWQKQKDNNNANHALVKQIKTQQMCYEKGIADMRQQMMAKAIDGDITFDYYGDDDKTYGCIAHDSFCLEDFGLKDRDKVKMILIKEDKL